MSKRNEINGWRCDTCGGVTYAVHVDAGVTPMFLACRASGRKDDCRGLAQSLMYPRPPVPSHVLEAVLWEWYRPSRRQVRKMSAEMRQHVEMGGLDLRPITELGRKALISNGMPS